MLFLETVFDAAASEVTEVGPPRRWCRLNPQLVSPEVWAAAWEAARRDETPSCARAALSELRGSEGKRPAPPIAKKRGSRLAEASAAGPARRKLRSSAATPSASADGESPSADAAAPEREHGCRRRRRAGRAT